MKSAQGTIENLMKSDFSSELTPFLTIIGVSPPLKDQPMMGGGARTLPKICSYAPGGGGERETARQAFVSLLGF